MQKPAIPKVDEVDSKTLLCIAAAKHNDYSVTQRIVLGFPLIMATQRLIRHKQGAPFKSDYVFYWSTLASDDAGKRTHVRLVNAPMAVGTVPINWLPFTENILSMHERIKRCVGLSESGVASPNHVT